MELPRGVIRCLLVPALITLTFVSPAQSDPPTKPASPVVAGWVKKSNENARLISDARATFAFNSTNVEGWGLYSEWLMEPYEPADGHLICLQHRLMRAARAFLDSELQTGKISREQALALLKNDVVLSDAMANQEVERYTFWAPGQANAYFYGYTRLRELRTDVEKTMGSRFNAKLFHGFVLAQGLLPPHLLRKVVFEEFVRGPHAEAAVSARPSDAKASR